MTGAAVTGAVRAVSKGADLTGELLVQHLASALGLPRGDDPWQVRAEALLETVRGLARPVVEDQAVAAGDQPSSGERELWTLSETCSLDVAARGGSTLEEVAGFLNITRERVRQIEARALVQIRRRPSRIAALQEHLHG